MSGFIIGENLICQFFYYSPNCQIKVLANFPHYTVHVYTHYVCPSCHLVYWHWDEMGLVAFFGGVKVWCE